MTGEADWRYHFENSDMDQCFVTILEHILQIYKNYISNFNNKQIYVVSVFFLYNICNPFNWISIIVT